MADHSAEDYPAEDLKLVGCWAAGCLGVASASSSPKKSASCRSHPKSSSPRHTAPKTHKAPEETCKTHASAPAPTLNFSSFRVSAYNAQFLRKLISARIYALALHIKWYGTPLLKTPAKPSFSSRNRCRRSADRNLQCAIGFTAAGNLQRRGPLSQSMRNKADEKLATACRIYPKRTCSGPN